MHFIETQTDYLLTIRAHSYKHSVFNYAISYIADCFYYHSIIAFDIITLC